MVGRLIEELHQTKPFESLSAELFLNILRTAFVLQRRAHQPLKPEVLSAEQYNVLRILRGAGPEGCACQQIVDRMISHDPDVTRLLDKLAARKLIMRERSTEDRRVVMARISQTGLALLQRLERPMSEALDEMIGHLSKKEATALVNLLERARENAG